MATPFLLRVWTRFLAPVEDVWRLKTDPKQISAEFFPFASFRLEGELRTEVGRMSARFGPPGLPLMPWPVELERWEEGKIFVDSSENLLYSKFRHEHIFEATPDGCRYIDQVNFSGTLPTQKLAAIALQRLFQHRHRVAAKKLPSDPQATAIAVLRVLLENEAPP